MFGRITVWHYFHFLVLHFGPYIFTKVTKVFIAKWRGNGKKILMYLDIGFCCHKDRLNAVAIFKDIKSYLLFSGSVPEVDKSLWDPVQIIMFLGVDMDTVRGVFQLLAYRVSKTRQCLTDIIQCVQKNKTVHARKLLKFLCQMISMSIVLGIII